MSAFFPKPSYCCLLAAGGLFVLGLASGWLVRGSGLATSLGQFLGLIPKVIHYASAGPGPGEVYVLLALGQSNAANFGEARSRVEAGVHAFASDRFFACLDPLPGANGERGSVWTRWAALQRKRQADQEVVIASVAQGSSAVVDWLPTGKHFPHLRETVHGLHKRSLTIDMVVWHQGETEAWRDGATGADYEAHLQQVINGLRALNIQAPIMICQTTRDEHGLLNQSIRNAQASVWSVLRNVWPGPDTDELGAEYRSDGIHFNARGLERFAEELDEAIQKIEERRGL